MARNYTSISGSMYLTSTITDVQPSFVLDTVAGLPTSTPFTLILEPGTEREEVVNVTSLAGLTVTADRGWSGTSAKQHLGGSLVRHGLASADLAPLSQHLDESTNVHGVGAASVVGTSTAQALTNKTIDAAQNTVTNLPTSAYSNASVTTAKLADSAVTEAKLGTGAVTTTKVGDGAVTLAKLASAVALMLVPTGTLAPTARATAPTGWLLCDGSAVSRTTYADLFAAIGTAFGAGDGVDTFNLPDARGRVLVGLSGDAEFNTLGETGGAKTHTHALSDQGFALASIALSGPLRAKQVPVTSWSADREIGTTTGGNSAASSSIGTPLGGNTNSESLLQPYLTVNYIIRH